MSEPRTRTAVEVADHASILLDEAQRRYRNPTAWTETFLLDAVERLCAQVEDLSAEVERLRRAHVRHHHAVGNGSRQTGGPLPLTRY